MLYIIPIEPIEERYSAQWLRWTRSYMTWLRNERKRLGLTPPAHTIINPPSYNRIGNGAFLDVVRTNEYKTAQMRTIINLFKNGKIKDGDIFWFHDIWFPGIEALAYMRDGLGVDVKIYGCLHAGTYDPHDFLTKSGMEPWGKHTEAAILEIADGIFLATCFHQELLSKARPCKMGKLHVTGFPILAREICELEGHEPWYEKKKRIVFPHRLDDEKQPELFKQLADELKEDLYGYEFVITKEVCQTKDQYYDLLRDSQFAVSFALQETWGIAMQEALFCGCIPIVPRRLSYQEMYKEADVSFFTDGSVYDTARAILEIVHVWKPEHPEALRMLNYSNLALSGRQAFGNMFKIMGV